MAKEINKEITIISEGTVIEGNISCEGNIRVDGEIKGQLKVQGNLTVGKTGKIEADVEANSCINGGTIFGNVSTRERLEILENAEIRGDISTKEIIINEKAIFNGYCKMNNNETKNK